MGASPALAQSVVSAARDARVIVVPNTPEGRAAVSATAARVLTTYRTFTLVEARGSQVDKLVAAGGEIRDDMRDVRMGAFSFDPIEADSYLRAKTGASPRLASKDGSGLMLVQYVGPLKDQWIDAVRATGVEVVSYMAQNAQLVAGDSAALAALSALPSRRSFIRAVIPYPAMAKLRPGLQKSGAASVVVSTVAGKAGDAARTMLARVSRPVGKPVKVAGIIQHRVSLDAGAIGELAEQGGVVAIEQFVAPKLLDERNSTILAGALNGSFQPVLGSGYLQYLQSKGFKSNSAVIVDITDEGLDKGVVPPPAGSHPDFFVAGNSAGASRIVYAQEATAGDSDARDCGGHGTNVASIATGFNSLTGTNHEDAQGFNYGLGVQPFGKVGATKIFNCAGSFDVQTSLTDLRSAAYAAGARISNNSWGAAVGGAYTAISQEHDALVRDAQPDVPGNQQMVEVFSAGNSGAGPNTIGAPGTGKNVITVGAAESVRQIGFSDGCGVSDLQADSARDIVDFSSRGPTDDGRIKPDIVAPGTHVTGAQPQTGADYNGSGTCNAQFPLGGSIYNIVSGTSQAAPVVTGFASLIRSWYRDNLSPSDQPPSPAMTKALMINTAVDLAGGQDGAGGLNANVPTQIQGWGRVFLGGVLNNAARQVVDQTARLTDSGTQTDRYYHVDNANRRLRVSLVWTDAVGPTTGNSFVNDLDLQVTAGGQTYKGNVLSKGLSATGGAFDTRNNVENVFLPEGVTGPIKVSVIGRNIAGDGVPGNTDATDQDYALLVSNATPRVGSLGVLNKVGMTATPLGDGDATFEPGEPFKLRVKLRNVGNATASPITGVLSASAGATVNQANTTWPDLAPNAAKQSVALLRGTISPSLECGDSAQLALAVSHNGSSFSLPISLRTGKRGTPATIMSSDVPKAIPDFSAGGVPSILALSGTGFVNEIQVNIGSITHTFVSDLQIDLTSPSGKTVRLFDRQGGSGDNLVNTVFSDAAATSITAGVAPFTGTFKPVEPLSVFKGESVTGNWVLTVRDLISQDTGTLQSWGLTRRKFVCS